MPHPFKRVHDPYLAIAASDIAKAFYSDVPDAQLVTRSDLSGEVWQIPCDKEVNVTFKFGGISFPIHPLDTNLDLNATDDDGNRVCFGAVCPCLAVWASPPLTGVTRSSSRSRG